MPAWGLDRAQPLVRPARGRRGWPAALGRSTPALERFEDRQPREERDAEDEGGAEDDGHAIIEDVTELLGLGAAFGGDEGGKTGAAEAEAQQRQADEVEEDVEEREGGEPAIPDE